MAAAFRNENSCLLLFYAVAYLSIFLLNVFRLRGGLVKYVKMNQFHYMPIARLQMCDFLTLTKRATRILILGLIFIACCKEVPLLFNFLNA